MSSKSGFRDILARARVDFPDPARPARTASVVLASAVALAGSLIADVLLVLIGRSAFPATRHYSHFGFLDYASLTTIGVAGAGAAWAVVTRVSSAPRWLLLRLAVAVSVLLLLPDLWLIYEHDPIGGVGILMCMHVAIAVITFFCLVWIAPEGKVVRRGLLADVLSEQAPMGSAEVETLGASGGLGELKDAPASISGRRGANHDGSGAGRDLEAPLDRWDALSRRKGPWLSFLFLLALDLVLGAVTVFFVPLSRPSGILPSKGEIIYSIHSLLGFLLGIGAVGLWALGRRNRGSLGRETRLAGGLAVLGIALAGLGGIATIPHGPARIMGLGLMLAGTVVAAAASIPLMRPQAGTGSVAQQSQPGTPEEPSGPSKGNVEPPIGWALNAPQKPRKRSQSRG